MAERSFFFNSAPGDPRTYQASDFAQYFGNVLSSGLIHTDNIPALEVKCEGNDLRTYVTPGKAIIQGYAYENTENLYLQHALPEPTLDRIDRIVLRLDKRHQSRYIRLFVKQGTPSDNPVPPDLQRDNFIYELSLAQIRVRANTSTLNPADLIDERLNEDLCGLVHSLISIPTSQFEREWREFMDSVKDEGFATQADLDALQQQFNAHLADNTKHITPEERTAWNGKYTKPAGGIPKTDLASDVQTSLNKANGAIQASEKGQPNGVAPLNASGKIDSNYLSPSGAMEKIAEIILSADAANIDIVNIPTDYKFFRILTEIKHATSPSHQPLYFILNGISSNSSYRSVYIKNTSFSYVDNAINFYIEDGCAAATVDMPSFSVIDISNSNNTHKAFTAITSPASAYVITTTGMTMNASLKNLITSIRFLTTGNFKTGSKVVLFGIK